MPLPSLPFASAHIGWGIWDTDAMSDGSQLQSGHKLLSVHPMRRGALATFQPVLSPVFGTDYLR